MHLARSLTERERTILRDAVARARLADQRTMHPFPERQRPTERPLCQCGCGWRVGRTGNRFINGHQRRFRNPWAYT